MDKIIQVNYGLLINLGKIRTMRFSLLKNNRIRKKGKPKYNVKIRFLQEIGYDSELLPDVDFVECSLEKLSEFKIFLDNPDKLFFSFDSKKIFG